MTRKTIILENEEESVYPEFTVLMKDLQTGIFTHCYVMVLSDKHPIFFESERSHHPPPSKKPTPKPVSSNRCDEEESDCDIDED